MDRNNRIVHMLLPFSYTGVDMGSLSRSLLPRVLPQLSLLHQAQVNADMIILEIIQERL